MHRLDASSPLTWDWHVPLAALLTTAALIQGVLATTQGGERTATLLLNLCATVPVAVAGRHPRGAAVVVTAATFALVGDVATLTAAAVVAQAVVVFQLAAARHRALAALVVAPFLGNAVEPIGGSDDPLAGVLIVVVLGGAAVLGDAFRGRGDAIAARDASRRETAQSQRELGALEERARIARELHDVVAHHLSVIAVQAETARLTVPDLPDQGKQQFQAIGDTARDALTEMRRLLGVLRAAGSPPTDRGHLDVAAVAPKYPGMVGSASGVAAASTGDQASKPADERAAWNAPILVDRRPQPGLDQLDELIEAARGSGMTVRLTLTGPRTPLPAGVELAAYRIVQEALTNARRHAPGAPVEVEIGHLPGRLKVLIQDRGPGASHTHGGGHGLQGMTERAAIVGGTLHAGTDPAGGFVVRAELPTHGGDV